ncbi:MAG: GH25 family lysozyme, partial [Oscillospiraceae bacterium]
PSVSPSTSPSPSPTTSPKPSPSAPPVFNEATEPVADGIVTEKVNGKDVKKLKPDFLKALGAKEEAITEKSKNPTYKNGWNVGKTSYYDGNGKKVTGRVVINGKEYSFDNNGILIPESRMTKGIDVSKYQPNIDWNAVKASGVEYAIIRVGYRGYGSGTLVEDPLFKQHIKGATAAGLKVGVYFFSQAITAQEAVDEASMALQLVQGYNLAYPIYFDTEYVGDGARADGLSSFHRTVLARGFCETVRNSGYKGGVYASKSWFYNQLIYEDIEKYDIWVAHYNTSTDFRHRYDMWQYTGRGSCPGISGSVDLNIAYKSY